MSKFILNRSIIRPLDFAFSTDVSIFSFVEKWTINGFWKAVSDYGKKLPTHVLQFVEIMGHLKILEMVVDNNDHKKMKLPLTAIEKYVGNGFFGDRIITIMRNKLYDDDNLRKQANERHLNRWADGKTNYDIEELAFFIPWLVKLFRLKNDNQKLVCSSELESELNKDGYSYKDFPLEKNPVGIISPWDEMSAKFCQSHGGNKLEIITLDKIYQ
jgi:hypothetical protein